jgi:hypothetical protein
MFRFLRRKKRRPLDEPCSICASSAEYGYSDHPEESIEKIRPLCLNCLRPELDRDYKKFDGRAVVVAPVAGPPVYVFQGSKEWGEHFPESKIVQDVCSLVERINSTCQECSKVAKFLWVQSRGLDDKNFIEVLDKGVSQTLLKDNAAPISLCATCCVGHIFRELESQRLSYFEICSPKGSDTGFVLPMGY